MELNLSEEERAEIEALGGFEKMIDRLRELLEEQEEKHKGGNKWIGTTGTSPFGAYGYNPEGIRISQQNSRYRRAVKVWDRREYQNLDDKVELGTRNIKIALRRLRKFAREGAADQLDLKNTIDKTARNAGLLDIRMMPERHNAIKVLLCLDVGGSMNDHPKAIWLNPEPEQRWDSTPSIKLTRELMSNRMFPLTISGLDNGIKRLH